MAFSEELLERLYKLELEQERQLQEIESLQKFPLFDLTALENKSTAHFLMVQKDLPKLPYSLKRTSGKNMAYKICLDFGNGSPASEWSEETRGWRSRGQGSYYADVQIAKEKLHELKSRWPNYPLVMSAVD
jgi:hypothetical protein